MKHPKRLRRRFSDELKRETVKQISEGSLSLKDASSRIGLPAKELRLWMLRFDAHVPVDIAPNARVKDLLRRYLIDRETHARIADDYNVTCSYVGSIIKKELQSLTLVSSTVTREVISTSQSTKRNAELIYKELELYWSGELLERSITSLGLHTLIVQFRFSERVNNVLLKNGIILLGDLLNCTEVDLTRLNDFFLAALSEVVAKLDHYGYRLRQDNALNNSFITSIPYPEECKRRYELYMRCKWPYKPRQRRHPTGSIWRAIEEAMERNYPKQE